MAVGVDHGFNDQWPSFWGDKTSTLDWCEENYLYSQYIAEFCTKNNFHTCKLYHYTHVSFIGNATSNFFFMYIAIKGAYDGYKAKLPIRLVVLYVWVFIVGLGSFLFHATLKWSMQLLDEIPMIYLACHILHCM